MTKNAYKKIFFSVITNGGIILKWGRLIPFTDYVWSDSLTTQAIW